MKKFYSLLASTILFSSLSFGNIGSAGNSRCGIGSMIFGSMDGVLSHSLEESTNTVWLNSSFSITFGTSGCSNSGLVNVSQSELLYANANYEEIIQELSIGNGEVLDGLANVMGCPTDSYSDFGQMSKSNAKEIISGDQDPAKLISILRTKIQSDKKLSKSCVS